MKSFQTIVLASFGLLALVGLAVFATSKGLGGGAAEVGPVAAWGTLPQIEVTEALGELSISDKRFTQVTYTEKPASSFSADLAQAIAEGQGPDLVFITQEQLLSERGKLAVITSQQLPERTFIDSFVPMSELFLTTGGAYGVPIVIDPLVFFYNRTALTDAGVASAPSSWEAVNGLAQSLTRGTAAATITRSVVPFGSYTNVSNARAIIAALFFQAGIPISTATDLGIESALRKGGEAGIASSEAAVDFYTQFADPAKTVYTWNQTLPQSRDAFIAGDLVFYPGFASEEKFIQNANPNLEFDMAPLPQPSTASVKVTYGLLYTAAVPRAAYNATGATEIALALSAPSATRQFATSLGMAPALRALLTPSTDDRYAAIYYPEALRARGWLSPASSAIDGIFAGMIGNVTSGRRSILEALETADDSLDALLP